MVELGSHSSSFNQSFVQKYQKLNFSDLVDQFKVFLFDAYGVLLTDQGVIPGSVAALSLLSERDADFKIVTNDASRSMSQLVEHYQSYGFPVTVDNIISSGMLVADYYKEHNLAGAKSLVLGPEQAFEYVTNAGGEIVDFNLDAEPEVVVILNERLDQNLTESFEILLSVILKQLNIGNVPRLILANPDLNYPSGPATFGLGPGSICLMLEASINNNFQGSEAISFVQLGKPNAPIFDRGLAGVAPEQAVFFGDQFTTDIIGANQVGISSALLLTGVSREESIATLEDSFCPKYVLDSLAV